MVAAAVWAPSVHNTQQPWRFTARGQQISLCADAERQLRVADPDGREMMISCGAALFTARLALRSLGYLPDVCLLPDPGQPLLVALVGWQRRAACTEFEQQLFGQVRQRRTHRGGFDPVPLPPGLLAALRLATAPTLSWCSGSGHSSRWPPACAARPKTSCPKAAAKTPPQPF